MARAPAAMAAGGGTRRAPAAGQSAGRLGRRLAGLPARRLAYPGANAPRAATARAIISLAAQRLGRLEEARTELAAAREIVDSKFRTRLDPGNPVQGFWFDWLFVRILLREAVAQLESAPRLS